MSVAGAFESSPAFAVEVGTDATIIASLQSPMTAMDIVSAVMSADGDPYAFYTVSAAVTGREMQIDSGDADNAADADELELSTSADAPEYAEAIAQGHWRGCWRQ